jgi:hypothetical protein
MPRGNPGIDVVESIRRRIWYASVKSKSGLSDYYLSKKFDLGGGTNSKTPKVRRRIFERLRKFNEMPFRGRHEAFVRLVDSYPSLAGTAEIYLSPLWKLLGTRHKLDIDDVRAMVVECVSLLCLFKVPGNFSDDGRDEISEYSQGDEELTFNKWLALTREGDTFYDQSLASAFLHVRPTFDYLALFGTLALEASMAGSMYISTQHLKTYMVALDEICSQKSMDGVQEEFKKVATSRILALVKPQVLPRVNYDKLIASIPDANLKSPAAAFLERHDRLIWSDRIEPLS